MHTSSFHLSNQHNISNNIPEDAHTQQFTLINKAKQKQKHCSAVYET